MKDGFFQKLVDMLLNMIHHGAEWLKNTENSVVRKIFSDEEGAFLDKASKWTAYGAARNEMRNLEGKVEAPVRD